MQLKKMHPDWGRLPTKDLLEVVSYQDIFPLLDQFTQYYNRSLSLCEILSRLGVCEVEEGTEEQQVPCAFIEHGSGDAHASARYYALNRDTGESIPAVYCHKCDKRLTALWYLYKFLHEYRGTSLKEVFVQIEREYRIPFPRELVLNFDPLLHYVFEEDCRAAALQRFQLADEIRLRKFEDFEGYVQKLIGLYRISE